MSFIDRFDAGRQLAARLHSYRDESPIVVGIAHGGVPVAFEVARGLEAALEIWIARKLCAPGYPDVALGAVSEGGALDLDLGLVAELALTRAEVDRVIAREAALVDRLGALLRGRAPLALRGQTVILVDDGVATGVTIRAVTRSIRGQRPARLLLAVPVGAADVLNELRPDFDRIICLEAEPILGAIGMRYVDFSRVSDAEVASLLAGYRGGRPQAGALGAPCP